MMPRANALRTIALLDGDHGSRQELIELAV